MWLVTFFVVGCGSHRAVTEDLEWSHRGTHKKGTEDPQRKATTTLDPPTVVEKLVGATVENL